MSSKSFPKIVSLLASSTETICALGFRHLLVGRSHECDFPKEVRSLPQCSRPKISIEKPSSIIDLDIKALLTQGLSIYEVDVEMLISLAPDLIVTQDHCAVCAVSYDDLVNSVCDLIPSKPNIVTLHPDILEDIFQDIVKISEAIDNGVSGYKLTGLLREELRNISSLAATRPNKPKVAFIEWIEPLMSGGNWMPELVSIAGGENLFGSKGIHSPYLSMKDLLSSNPDIIIVAPCGFDLTRTESEMMILRNDPSWQSLRAVKTGKVAIVDGNALFNRPGPRLVESARVLESIFFGDTHHELKGYWKWWT